MTTAGKPPLFDAHNHLQDAALAPHHEQVLADLRTLPLGRAVVNGTSVPDWADVAALARAHPVVLPSYGLHPWDAGNAAPGWRETLIQYLDTDPAAAVGEIGLDRWMLDRARPDDPRLAGLRRAPLGEQEEAFVWQLALAAERNRPASIHCLAAWGALAACLRTTPRPARGFLLHAYNGSANLARELAGLGAYFSFNGGFLAERHAARRAVFAELPLDRLLVETDAPAMIPPPAQQAFALPGTMDGAPINHPANLGEAYAGLAAVRGMSGDALARQVEDNFHRLFG
jgi:TatD DNase family protein